MRKLGLPAEEKYEALIELASTLAMGRTRSLQMARFKRYLAEAVSAGDPRYAYQLLAAVDEKALQYPGALLLKFQCEPLALWERLEKADAHYLTAYCAKRSGYPVAEQDQLNEASAEYERVRIDLSSTRWRGPRNYLRLRARIKDGIRRVTAAKNGIYQIDWLP